MSRTMATVATFLVLLGFTTLSQAQRVASPEATESTTCAFNFSSGANNTFLKYCVSSTGNILLIETPQGHEQLIGSVGTDGYGLCNESPATSYWDYAFDGASANWSGPVLLSQTAKSVKIARTTLDGIWTLTQTISLVPATPAIKIVMALKNNTSAPRVAYLLRFADVNADTKFLNNFGATLNSAFGWEESVPFVTPLGFGLQLQNVGNSQFGFVEGFARTTFHGPNPCNFAGDSSGPPLVNIDGSIVLAYADTIGANKTKIATMLYRGQ